MSEEKFITELSGFGLAPGSKILLACSAGIDSVAMVSLFAQTQQQHDFLLHIGHVNHNLRSVEEGKKDQDIILFLSDRYQIPYDIASVDLQVYSGGAQSVEASARHARYEKLQQMADAHGCDYIALAHNQDDVVETIYMRLLQQYGLFGLGGIPRMRDRIFRPVLGFCKSELREYLQTQSIAWHEDVTNVDSSFLRNRLRQELSQIAEINTQFRDGLLHLAAESQEWKTALDDLMEGLHGQERYEDGIIFFPLDVFAMQDTLIQRRLIYRWFNLLMKGSIEADFRLPKRFVDTLKLDRGKIVLRGYGILLEKKKGELIFSKEL